MPSHSTLSRTRRSLLKTLATGAILALTASGCKNLDKEVGKFTEESVKLTVLTEKGATADGAIVLTGSIPFKNIHYYTAYRHVCDQQLCGYDRETRCDPVERCSSIPSCHTDTVCRDVPDTVCRTDSEGRENCTTVTRRECERVERCGSESVCHTDTVCRDITVPRYCDVNCREEPYTASHTQDRSSNVTLKIHGVDPTRKDAGLSEAVLGIHTNSDYRTAIDNTGTQPKELQKLLKNLKRDDQTLLVLGAKRYELVEGQEFLRLPENFKAGQPLHLEVTVKSSSEKKAVSALGTTTKLPPLTTTSHE